MQKKIIGVIGPDTNNCTPEIYDFGLQLGKIILDLDAILVCGGKGGIMEAACKGAYESKNYQTGRTIGILPSENKQQANAWCDIVVPTGIGIARNTIIPNMADVLVAVAGGSGTLSEIAFAWQKGIKVICCIQFDGWSRQMAGQQLDNRHKELLIPAINLEEIKNHLTQILKE